MSLGILLFIFGFIFLSNLNFIRGQSEVLSCSYSGSTNSYTCSLTIINPNGLNNFTGINGMHLSGMTDEDVRYVYGAAGSTPNIPSIICEKFKNTQKIEIFARGLQIIDEDSFQNCKNLTHLNLYNNKIRQFHKNAFKENPELNQLLLWFNEITELPEDPFTNLQKLVRLDFESNNITVLPENIFNPLTGLDVLYLEKNLIEILPTNIFSSLKNMTTFWIYSNKLKIVHADSFGLLPKLKTVQMYSNQIDAIDEKFINNTGINRFDVRYNLCLSKDISDTTASRGTMRADLKICFENYEEIMSGKACPLNYLKFYTIFKNIYPGCANGNLDERVCNLESQHEEVVGDIKALAEENEKMRSEIDNLAMEKQELEEFVRNQNKIFSAAIEELEHQLFELKGCTCSC